MEYDPPPRRPKVHALVLAEALRPAVYGTLWNHIGLGLKFVYLTSLDEDPYVNYTISYQAYITPQFSSYARRHGSTCQVIMYV